MNGVPSGSPGMDGVPGGSPQPDADPHRDASASGADPHVDAPAPGADRHRDALSSGTGEPGPAAPPFGGESLAGPDAHQPGTAWDFSADRVVEDAADAQDRRLHRTAPLLQWPLMVVLAGLLVSLLIVATDHFRRGSVLFAACVVGAFVLRLILPDRDTGWLAVRSRGIDLMVLAALGVSLTVFALIVPPPS